MPETQPKPGSEGKVPEKKPAEKVAQKPGQEKASARLQKEAPAAAGQKPEQEKSSVQAQRDTLSAEKPAQKPEEECIPKSIIEEEKQKLLRMSEIGIWVEDYEHIFSDFDSRPYSQRALSDDFLREAKKASMEKISGVIELKFLLPEARRNPAHEAMVKKRLRDHFKKHHDLLKAETAGIKKRGGFLALVGITMMFAATSVYELGVESFLYRLLFVLLEPGGWFAVWFGLDQIFYTAKEKKPDLDFYEKMSKCNISFMSY